MWGLERELIEMLVSSSPWPLPLSKLLLLDTPTEIKKKKIMQKIQARRHQKEGKGGGRERREKMPRTA